MGYKLTIKSDGGLKKHLDAARQRARNPRAATARWGEGIARIARSRAPVGYGSGTLKRSLNHVEPDANTTVLVSDRPYARIQNYGGQVAATGVSRISPPPKMLAIPVSLAARQLMATLGAGQSLRSLDLTMIETPRGVFLVRKVGEQAKSKSRIYRGKRIIVNQIANVGDPVQRLEIMFVLKKSVTLKPNPGPDGYAPRISEAAVRAEAAKAVRALLRGGI